MTNNGPLLALSDAREVCTQEVFEASCRGNQVIRVKTAKFGRMRVGRCVPRDRAYSLDCFTDVTRVMERECSGRQRCRVKVPHVDFHSPCPKDLASYLDVDYVCRAGRHKQLPIVISNRRHVLGMVFCNFPVDLVVASTQAALRGLLLRQQRLAQTLARKDALNYGGAISFPFCRMLL